MKKNKHPKEPRLETLHLPGIYLGEQGRVTNKALVEAALLEEQKTNYIKAEYLLLHGAAVEKYIACASSLMRFYTRQRWHRESRSFFYSLPLEKKNKVPIRFQLALNLLDYGKVDEAIESFTYCQNKHPANVELLCYLAKCHASLGNKKRARDLFEAAAQLDPKWIVALRELSDICDPQDIPRYRGLLNSVLRQPILKDKEKVECLFGLAKLCRRSQDIESEIELLEKANRLAEKAYSGVDFRAQRILNMQVVQKISELEVAESELPRLEKDVVLIVCLPRAGASLLESRISERFSAGQTGEVDLFNSAIVEYMRRGNDLRFSSIQIDGAGHFQFDYGDLVSGSNRANILKCYNDIIQDINEDSAVLVNKSIANAWQAPVLMKMAQNVKVICLSRDSRDLAISALQSHFENSHGYIYSAEELSKQIRHHKEMVEIWANQFPGRVAFLSYEDFVSDSESCLDRLGKFLALSPAKDTQGESVTLTSSIWQVRRDINSDSVGKWKNYRALLQGQFDSVVSGSNPSV